MTASQGKAVLLLQFTDPHLLPSEADELWGLATSQSLQQVVAMVRSDLARRGLSADLLVASGDIAHGGSAAGYQRFRALTQGLAGQQAWVPGNHDDYLQMRSVAPELVVPQLEAGPWRVLLVNSQVPGQVYGGLDDAAVEQLKRQLSTPGDCYFLVVMHHPPFAVGTPGMDAIGLKQADWLWQLLDAEPRVRGVLCGHVHQDYQGRRGRIQLLASPSTGVQFTPGAKQFALSREAPGYRWLLLRSDGGIDTGISRLADFHFEPAA